MSDVTPIDFLNAQYEDLIAKINQNLSNLSCHLNTAFINPDVVKKAGKYFESIGWNVEIEERSYIDLQSTKKDIERFNRGERESQPYR